MGLGLEKTNYVSKLMEDSPIDYASMRDVIHWDKSIESLKRIKGNLEKALVGINDSINERQAEIVIENELGCKGNDELHKSFPNTKDYRDYIDGILIVTLLRGDTKRKFYFSKELDIFIKGEPEKRKDGLYCQITGHKISK